MYSLQGGLTQDSYFDVLSNGNIVVIRDLMQDPVKRNSYTVSLTYFYTSPSSGFLFSDIPLVISYLVC